jgi:hypothetical protein
MLFTVTSVAGIKRRGEQSTTQTTTRQHAGPCEGHADVSFVPSGSVRGRILTAEADLHVSTLVQSFNRLLG